MPVSGSASGKPGNRAGQRRRGGALPAAEPEAGQNEKPSPPVRTPKKHDDLALALRPNARTEERDCKRKNAAGRKPSGVEERSEEDLTNLFSRHASADLATTYSPAS